MYYSVCVCVCIVIAIHYSCKRVSVGGHLRVCMLVGILNLVH